MEVRCQPGGISTGQIVYFTRKQALNCQSDPSEKFVAKARIGLPCLSNGG
ncbi:hypothetical protein AVEN_45426-1, partial [Araneus ventricosus]